METTNHPEPAWILKRSSHDTASKKRGAGTGSSHFTFRKKDHYPITIPKKNRIKKIYIIKVKEIVEKEETNICLHETTGYMYKIKKASE